MSGLLDWLGDAFGSSSGSSMPPMQMTGSDAPPLAPPPDMSGNMGRPVPPPAATQPMPPVQQTGADQPFPPGTDPMTAGTGAVGPYAEGTDPMTAGGSANGPGPYPPGTDPMTAGGPSPAPPVPMPQPRPPGANPPPAPSPAAPPPGAPISLAPPGNGAAPGPGANAPAQTFLGRAFGITDKQGQQAASGLAAGLKAIGGGAGVGQGKFAALAGGAGTAMEGVQKRADTQQKQAADYLKSAIDSKAKGDEAGYKQNYLRYLAAKLQADTDKAASKDATTNKNDTPTQLYLSAQRLVQPDRNAANKLIEQMGKDGADPAEIAKKRAELDTAINTKLSDHYATLGIHPQTAAQIAQQPGNSQQNPIDGGKMGLTRDNIGSKLQPGQWFKNPADGKLIQYNPDKKKGDSSSSKKAIPDKPTNPEPANPMNKSDISTGASGGSAGASSDDDED